MIDRLALLKQKHLDRLRNLESRIQAEFTEEELSAAAEDLNEISTEIAKIEVGQVWWVEGPGGKLFRCEKTDVAS